jgi:hypothetical protein
MLLEFLECQLNRTLGSSCSRLRSVTCAELKLPFIPHGVQSVLRETTVLLKGRLQIELKRREKECKAKHDNSRGRRRVTRKGRGGKGGKKGEKPKRRGCFTPNQDL